MIIFLKDWYFWHLSIFYFLVISEWKIDTLFCLWLICKAFAYSHTYCPSLKFLEILCFILSFSVMFRLFSCLSHSSWAMYCSFWLFWNVHITTKAFMSFTKEINITYFYSNISSLCSLNKNIFDSFMTVRKSIITVLVIPVLPLFLALVMESHLLVGGYFYVTWLCVHHHFKYTSQVIYQFWYKIFFFLLFHFYLMFPNIKKSRFLHQLSQIRPCRAIQCVQQSLLPFSFCCSLYNSVIDRKLDHMCLNGKNVIFIKTCRADSTLSANQFTVTASFSWGTWNRKIKCPILFSYPTTKHK